MLCSFFRVYSDVVFPLDILLHSSPASGFGFVAYHGKQLICQPCHPKSSHSFSFSSGYQPFTHQASPASSAVQSSPTPGPSGMAPIPPHPPALSLASAQGFGIPPVVPPPGFPPVVQPPDPVSDH